MYTVYVLKSLKDGNLYVGCSANLIKRIKSHKKGKVRSTKGRLPIKLIYTEQYLDKYEAYRRERFYKTTPGKRFLKTRINR